MTPSPCLPERLPFAPALSFLASPLSQLLPGLLVRDMGLRKVPPLDGIHNRILKLSNVIIVRLRTVFLGDVHVTHRSLLC